LLLHRYVGCVFYHLKGLKRDRGLGNLARDGTSTAWQTKFEDIWTNPDLMTFEQFQLTGPAACRLPLPETIGIRPLQTTAPREASLGKPTT
jgi:hypothetical protein